VSKLAAGREKDLEFEAAPLRRGLIEGAMARERISTLNDPARTLCIERLKRIN
jgi:hypothetical protein